MGDQQGRGIAGGGRIVSVQQRLLLAFCMTVQCCALLASAATLTVGGSEGWDVGVDYSAWAASQTFAAGDVLFFPYASGAHDVVEVDKAGYDACSAASDISTHSEGNTNITLSSAGTYYYLCSFPSHCTGGMKLAVTVGASATAPAPTSVGTPPPSPSPPALQPTSPPSAPSPSPSPPTPPPTPVPSVGAPASTPTPSPASVPTLAPSSAPTPISAPVPGATPPSASGPPTPPASSPPNVAPRLSPATALLFAFLSAALLTTL